MLDNHDGESQVAQVDVIGKCRWSNINTVLIIVVVVMLFGGGGFYFGR